MFSAVAREQDMERVFVDRGAWAWITQAGHTLDGLQRSPILSHYLMYSTHRAIAGKKAQLQLRRQKRTWRSIDDKVCNIYTTIHGAHVNALRGLNGLNNADPVSVTAHQINTACQDVEALNKDLLVLHDFFTYEIRYLQLVSSSFFGQTEEYRRILQKRYMTLLGQRLQRVYMASLLNVLQWLQEAKMVTDAIYGKRLLLPQCAALTTFGVAVSDTAAITQRLDTDLIHLRQIPRDTQASLDSGNFWTMTTSGRTSGDERMQTLATREMQRLEDGPVKKLVQRWLHILSTNGILVDTPDVGAAPGPTPPATDPELASMMETIRRVTLESLGRDDW